MNEGEPKRKLPKMFAGKNLRMGQKSSRADLIKNEKKA